MKTIVVATGNVGKIREFKEILVDWTVKSPRDYGIDFDAEETGSTFAENAAIKARALYEILKIPTVADDSGLCVDALNGAPGIYSARYSGGSDSDNNKKLLDNMRGITNRRARFVCALAYYDGKLIEVNGETEGEILSEPMGDKGFGYDPLFYSYDLKQSFGVASEIEKNSVSHRKRAIVALLEKLTDND